MKTFNFTLIFIFLFHLTVSAQENAIRVSSKRNKDKSVTISYTKNKPGSYYIKLIFDSLENCDQSDFEKVVKHRSGTLLTLKPINEKQHITNIAYTFSYIKGHPNPKVQENLVYLLPFKKGKTIKINETVDLKDKYLNVKSDLKWKSFIADLKTSDTIYNMRKGIVVDIKGQNETNPSDIHAYTSKLNRISIEHKDGTIATYTGFKKEAIFVQLGQIVYPQTKLGSLAPFNSSFHRLYFDVSYLRKKDLFEQKKYTHKNIIEHLDPFFYHNKKTTKLKNNQHYTVDVTQDILLKEFTRKEKKKFKNTPSIFQ